MTPAVRARLLRRQRQQRREAERLKMQRMITIQKGADPLGWTDLFGPCPKPFQKPPCE